jgi:hypothetical protein
MTTLIDFIVDQSSLPVGNTVRDHIENPSAGGDGGVIVHADGLSLEVLSDTKAVVITDPILVVTMFDTTKPSVAVDGEINIELDESNISVEIQTDTIVIATFCD